MHCPRLLWGLGLSLWLPTIVLAQANAEPSAKEIQEVVDKAIAFLKTRQNPDGSFAPKFGGPGISGLVAAGMLLHGVSPDDPLLAKTLKYLESNVQPNGGIYSKGLANYSTCVALLAFQQANTNGRYNQVIQAAAKYLKSLQTGDAAESDTAFGGVGYDGRGRPDVSNTQFFLEALLASGVAKDDPAIKRALVFLSRCQNLPGEANDRPYAIKATPADKGGFVYNPLEADNAKSPKRTPAGGLRSEGGMTYAGLKSFLYAGVSKDDPRVRGAIDWIRRHYTLSENPGMGTAGLFYYYHTFAKAMDALGENPFRDADGQQHLWKRELFDTLKKAQNPDGSWSNKNPAFLENQPELATAFALLALSYVRPTSP